MGTRLTWAGARVGGAPVDVVGGVDLLRDRTCQDLVQAGRNWVPEATFLNAAPFVQLDADPVPGVTADVGPDRLNLSVDLGRGSPVSGRVQAFRYFDRDFRDGDGDVTARFDGYTTLDASVTGALGGASVTLSVADLLDRQYITYYGQAATDRNDRYFAGRGRTPTLRVDHLF